MSAATGAIFEELEADVRPCEEALRRVDQQLNNKNKWWRRKRIRRRVRSGAEIEAALKAVVAQFTGMLCPETQESVVTPELLKAIEDATTCSIHTAKGLKSPIGLLQGTVWMLQHRQVLRTWISILIAAKAAAHPT
jgi:hypothetical protein